MPLQTPGTGDQVGYVKIRQKPIEYTGPYVLHCHILGHEDRGMMSAIQSVCPDGTPAAGNYGMPDKTKGTPDRCSTQAAPAFPTCTNACTAQKQ